MCIKKKIAEIQQEIDTKLRLKSLLEKTQPLLTSISIICSDYREVAPEELPFLMDEIWAACKIDLSVAAISATASTGDEKVQDFAFDAMTQAIEQCASAAFQLELQQQPDSPPESEPEYEPEECTDSIQRILESKGFYEPDVNLRDLYEDPEDNQGSYDGWDIYCSMHDSGQVMSIGLTNEKLNQFWDVGTEFLADHDPTFPKSVSEKQPILAWVRSVIDLLPIEVPDYSEAPGQLALEFPADADALLTGEEYDAAVEKELSLDDDDDDDDDVPTKVSLEPTKLQKLLEGSNCFIFEELRAKVKVDSEFIKNNHGEEPEITEEALFTVTDLVAYLNGKAGEKVQHYYHSAEDLTDWKPIAGWNPLGNLMNVAESYAKKWAKEQSSNLIKEFSITNLPLPHAEMRARVTPAIGDGKFAGATFTFYRGTEELFSSSETAEQIARGENNPELIAVALVEDWKKRQELKNQSPAGTTHTEPPAKDEFTELVYVGQAVAYLKRKDTGEVLTAYLGFSNKTPEGDRAPTTAKSRAIKWQEHLAEIYQLACSGPRECQRIKSNNAKMPFKYELKLVKPSMGQLQKLSEENFGLYPDEIKKEPEGSETSDRLSDFEFDRVTDFDDLNPEFLVKYQGIELTNIWSSLRTTTGEQPQRLWRHGLLKPGEENELKDKEAAAFHALQRTRGLA